MEVWHLDFIILPFVSTFVDHVLLGLKAKTTRSMVPKCHCSPSEPPVQTVPDFMMVWKQSMFSGNHSWSVEVWTFPGLAIMGTILSLEAASSQPREHKGK